MKTLEKLSDQVTNKIRHDIDQDKYKAGEKIPAEPELMKLYGVGRSTIREAIKTLAMTGILTVQQGSGTFVCDNIQNETIDQRLRRADFDEINAVRKLLEDEMVRLALKNHTEEDLEDMKQSLENRKLAILSEQRQACVDADIAFHIAIARASSNKVLADLYQNFTAIIRDFFSKREVRGISHFAMSHHLHEQLFEAIKNKKEKLAQQVLDKIIENNY
ncbi:FadR/GntR family transcriptional regulator [Mucilaginibacter sp.]|uniref:FadR/GntR family transcriptional regulator n=1 Tax=Mucilaginibacter sp. TaxID=1882438 RepID=UPI00260AFD68|nr:FadR/GntR family transcriptional regulator [Mucilaginibacter sp.]MDB4922486.1 transcriptional regulator [Mucilaginibacter sp.]